jgi:pullulanase
MKRFLILWGFLACLFGSKAQSSKFKYYPVYNGTDLGLTYTASSSIFKVWSPVAAKAELLIYPDGDNSAAEKTIAMTKDKSGVWVAAVKGDLKNKFYAFRVQVDGQWMKEVPDPYAKVVGINGQRAMVVDLKNTNPAGWENDKSPLFRQKTDAVIYELHVRDASIATNSGIQNKGKFIGLIETGTVNKEGLSTGIDHIKELGITHVHLLPSYDYNSVDEKNPSKNYNWGYDPQNYNAPEGSYATDAYNGAVRIKEFKQLINTFHENGLRVVMDVVYNHTALTEKSNFNQLVPGYYYRQTKDGKFSNATACGNETASERPMFRKFMLESMKYWVQEYHVDGFRVDLMGVHDIATMNLIAKELHRIKPDILIYGEGWTAGASPLPDSLRALKKNAAKLDRIAVFSDDIRDGIKGSVFEHDEKGFASGKPGMEESIKFGIVASCKHPQVNYKKVNYSKAPYAAQPYHTISYCECHDNHVLWDKLGISAKDATEEERINMHKLALSIVLTSQGISFLHAGTEFLRSKNNVENSYNSPDSINVIDWSLKTKNKAVFDYVKALIAIRRGHPAFRLATQQQVAALIKFDENNVPGVISYTINGAKAGDSWKRVKLLFNGTGAKQTVSIKGQWKVAVANNATADISGGFGGNLLLLPYSCTVLYQE